MKTMLVKSIILVVTLHLLLGCNAVKNANNTQKGTAIGASGGAVLGGIIGNNVGEGNTVLGVIIGAAVGGAAGGYIGNRMDRQAEEIREEIPGAEVERIGEGISVTFSGDEGVYFDTNQSVIKGESAATLNKLAQIFQEYPNSDILVGGHTDSDGSDTYNMTLSMQRALAVTNYLVSRGISSERFTTKWYGETQPRASNTTAAGKAQNRRVELAIVANKELKKEASRQTR